MITTQLHYWTTPGPRIRRKRIERASDIFTLWKAIRRSNRTLDPSVEHGFVFLVNKRNDLIAYEHIATGIHDSFVVCTQTVFRAAVRLQADAIIFVHNHPSGDVSPSKADIDITTSLCNAGGLLAIPVVDSIIVSDHDYKSLLEAGLLPTSDKPERLVE